MCVSQVRGGVCVAGPCGAGWGSRVIQNCDESAVRSSPTMVVWVGVDAWAGLGLVLMVDSFFLFFCCWSCSSRLLVSPGLPRSTTTGLYDVTYPNCTALTAAEVPCRYPFPKKAYAGLHIG